jgi:hypothetical protein
VYDGHAHDVGVFNKVVIWFYLLRKFNPCTCFTN